MAGSDALQEVAALFKRVKNISKGVDARPIWRRSAARLVEPAEVALRDAVVAQTPAIRGAAADGDYRRAFSTVASLGPVVARFFDDVMVMAEDESLRTARLQLVANLRDVILRHRRLVRDGRGVAVRMHNAQCRIQKQQDRRL